MPEKGGDPMELEDRLERDMTELGPLVQRRRQAEAEGVNPEFAATLRSQLMTLPMVSDATDTAHRPRGVLRLHIPTRRRSGFVRAAFTIASVGLIAAIIALVVLSRDHAPARTRVAFAPRPSTADLTRGYPTYTVGGGEGGMELPITSSLSTVGAAYPVHLHLTASRLPLAPAMLRVYRLARPSLAVPRAQALARQLGIPGPVTFWNDQAQITSRSKATWVGAAIGSPPSRSPLHSLATSLNSGELLYHDMRYPRFGYQGLALARNRATELARSWLGRLGWPQARMPVLSVTRAEAAKQPGTLSPLSVTFGWPGVPRANVPAAVVWVSPDGRVIEALVWPPIVRRESVASTSTNTAWNLVRSGKAPIALPVAVFSPYPSGQGILQQVSVVEVLVTSQRRQPYLVPAYRFAGTVRLGRGQGKHPWYALVPAIAR